MANSATQGAGLEFEGKKAEQELAEVVFGLFRARGAFFAATAPISLTVGSLAEALSSMGNDASEADIQGALDANAHIFTRDESGDEPVYVTTKNGTPPGGSQVRDDDHGLVERFATPEPPRERVRPRSSSLDIGDEGDETEQSPQVEFPPDSWQAAVAAALREAGQESADVILPDTELPAADAAEEDEDELVEAAVDVPEPVEATEEPVEAEDDVVEEPVAEDEEEDVVVEQAAPEPIAVPDSEPVSEIDVADSSDNEIAEAIELALRDDPEAVRWGEQWMLFPDRV